MANKYIRFLAMVFIAISFHNTAVIFLFALLFKNIKFNKRNFIIFIYIGFIVFLFNSDIINLAFEHFPSYKDYLNSNFFVGDNNIKLGSIIDLIVSSFLIFPLIYFKVFKPNSFKVSHNKFDNNEHLFLWFLTFGFLIILFSTRFNLLSRVADYFLVIIIIFIPNSLNSLKNQKLASGLFISIFLILVFYQYGILIFRPEWYRIIPYDLFWAYK
jgi:hypothetical protein